MAEKKENNRFTASLRAFEQAGRYIPGGVNSPVRAFGGVELSPVFINSALGSRIYDIDGNEYIDYVGSWGPMIAGHGNPLVIEAVSETLSKGTSFGAPTEAETELSRRITEAFGSVEKVRLVSSGTEAVMTAVRLARAFTGRDIIIKMAGCYHGHSDSMLVAAGSGAAECSSPSSAGVPAQIAALTVVVDYNDIDQVRRAFEKHRNKIAAVLIEPIAANMSVVLPRPGYLQSLRQLCDNNESLLIFDEVITGFRAAYGGAQQFYGVNADITCLGKIIGGGLPAAALGARADIMDRLAPEGNVYQAGTLSGNPLAVSAAIAVLDILRSGGKYEQLEEISALLQAGLLRAAQTAGIDITINRAGSIMGCFFTDRSVENFKDVQSTDIRRFKRFFSLMLYQGIYLAPSAYEAIFISLAHSPDDVKKTVKAAENAFNTIKKEG